MEEGVQEVLYETRYHTSRPYSPNYPPQHQQLNEGVKGNLFSLLSSRGVSQLKEKWSGYRSPRKVRKWASLFVSPRGERVAVAVGNQLTILQKDDDYQQPCGLFTSSSLGAFTVGIWSENHDVLGVANDDMLYFIKANGEEITRITKRNLKVSSSIVGLIALDDFDMNKSCLCSFNVLTSDGSLREVEISQHPSASIFSACTSNNRSTLKEFPENIFCLNYHPDISLLAVVGAAVSVPVTSSGIIGTYTLSLWRRTKSLDLEPVFHTEFEGLYSKPKGYVGRLTSPKVLFSPEGKFVAALDLRGHLVIFKLDNEQYSLSSLSCGEKYELQARSYMPSRETESMNDIVDFTWWSDYILALAKRSGIVTMIDIFTGIKLLEKDPLYCMPTLENVQKFPGCLFLLETTSENHDSSNKEARDLQLQHIDLVTEDNYSQFDITKLHWSLISFSKKSVSEMYDALICDQKYQAALDLASRHGLDEDEVLKSQWLHSVQGLNEINMFLSVIKDQVFVLSECVDRVGPTEEAMRTLIAHGLHLTNNYRFSETKIIENSQIWDFRLARLKLLQFRDKLETFLGINMGRFSVQEYSKFRCMPINEAAVTLAESGKIGALNLLFKRHPYSLTPSMLEILAAIPETVPVQSYGQLLPGNSPPSSITLREKDWVECQDMVTFISRLPENRESSVVLRTEPIMKQLLGFSWPSTSVLSLWYKSRARDIDSLSGQLDNCLSLVDFACRKGVYELQQFHEDISYLHLLIYSDSSGDELNFSMSLVAWEQLSDYEKFKMMLKGVEEENVIKRLCQKAIPFMQNRFHITTLVSEDAVRDEQSLADKKADSFLVRWLKEIASENKLDICLKVIEEGCRDLQSNSIFRDKVEVVDCALQCIYLCTTTDRWSTMASILSKLPELRDSQPCVEGLKKRLKAAEGHIEAGRLLSFYQVPKCINFFLEAHSDGRGVKQILRLILSKFVRRQPGRSDNDWANMWRDLQSLQEKAFLFLDQEYMLMEFCRGLLKAGKFSLARNYLRGTASVALTTDKAENLVIQAAREYFFSASSLTCSEVWKARECLNLFPGSRNVRAEADIIDALTVKLPNLGVTVLPVQFRQIKDPMEIIKLAITSQVGAYLNVDELIETAKLLGLSSQDDLSAVQEAIAREAAVAGDLQLAFDLCLVLAKKDHGSIWDLCAAIARGPDLENMDISSRKQLLGFALSYCDEESIGELLAAWKDLDMQGQCEKLMILTGTYPPKSANDSSFISFPLRNSQDTVDLRDYSEQVDGINCDDQEANIKDIKNILYLVAKDLSKENGSSWEALLGEHGKILSFAALRLPWLLELTHKVEHGKKLIGGLISGKQYISVRTQAVVTILSWLARHDFAPRDDLIASLAKSIMEPPVTEEGDIMGSSFLLNLIDAFHGVEIIEEQVRTRKAYNEICSIMSVGMVYSLLHNSSVECESPTQRRELLLMKFQETHSTFSSGATRNVKGFSPELQSKVFPWEGWDDLRSIVKNNETTANRGVPCKTDASSRLTSTLVALKSSQLVGVISNSIQIRTDDLLTVDSAVSFFVRLCEVATSETHFDALLTILEEWEGLFTIKRDDTDSAEAADAANDWSNDGWDEGWESIQEEESVPKETKKDDPFSVHPLHLCWMEIFKKLVTLSRFIDLLKLIDQFDGVLLDQVGTHCLGQIVLGIDCFAALKLALLLPYEETHLQCLDAVEEKLKQGDISNTICKDHEFLILVLSSGLVSTIISRSAYGTTFSFLCYMVGNFSRRYQEAQLTGLKHRDRNRHENNEKDVLFLFRSVLFPGFVSKLVKADQQILAGFIVTKFVHTNASLSLINIAEASLIRYLERQLQILQDEGFTHQDLGFGEPLVNTISQLSGRLEDLIQFALSSLRADVRCLSN